MNLVLSIIKAVVAWFLLMFIGTNIIGFIVRGLVEMLAIKKLEDDTPTVVRGEATAYNRFNRTLTVLFIVIGAAYICVLYWVWNIGVAAAALILMITRIPDLLREIRTRQKITLLSMPRTPFDFVLTIIDWAMLPLLWFALR
jgi:hypothetical protein